MRLVLIATPERKSQFTKQPYGNRGIFLLGVIMTDLFLKYLKEQENLTTTDNGAVALRDTGDYCLDLFMAIGSLRFDYTDRIFDLATRAYVQDKDLFMKILFYARDIRCGLGERETFRRILTWLSFHGIDSLEKNITKIAEFGRYDDLLCLLGTPAEKSAVKIISEQLNKDLANLKEGKPISLLAKWLPSINASSYDSFAYAVKLSEVLGMTKAAYRKTLSALRKHLKIIENNLRERVYNFDYEKVPSMALFRYRQAFLREDNDRYVSYLEDVKSGKKTIKTTSLEPYQIVTDVIRRGLCSWMSPDECKLSKEEKEVLDVTWNALPDYTNGQNALAIIDGSGSMYSVAKGSTTPASVAFSLGIYFAEHTKGAFHNHFITFSKNPRLVEIKGKDIYEKVIFCSTFEEIANTDIEAVFKLILKTAVKNNLPQSELPEVLYIISDMQFDVCTDNADLTNYQNAAEMFARYGYKLPSIVFWNVNASFENCPVAKNEQGTILVSGFTSKLFSMVITNDLDPYKYMMKTLSVDRYKDIVG